MKLRKHRSGGKEELARGRQGEKSILVRAGCADAVSGGTKDTFVCEGFARLPSLVHLHVLLGLERGLSEAIDCLSRHEELY